MAPTASTMTTTMTGFRVSAIDPAVLSELRIRDDAGQPPRLLTDDEGGSPLRCCLRRIEPGERVALVSYAPLRRWASRTGADPGPFDEVGPVFIHPEPCPGPADSTAGFPPALASGRWMLRQYAAAGHILGGHLVDLGPAGDAAAANAALAAALAEPGVALVHVRAIAFGCFQFEVTPA
ncbi:MAG TPA: DUF1203 domain-containing protein [Streptosporangiaceae bacterium]|nr:DUF1203 domain-containing protein [Streptosporangiaceae bacterium]